MPWEIQHDEDGVALYTAPEPEQTHLDRLHVKDCFDMVCMPDKHGYYKTNPTLTSHFGEQLTNVT